MEDNTKKTESFFKPLFEEHHKHMFHLIGIWAVACVTIIAIAVAIIELVMLFEKH